MPPSRVTAPEAPSPRCRARRRRTDRRALVDPVALAVTGRLEAAGRRGRGRFRLEALISRGRALHGVATRSHSPLLLALHGPSDEPVGAIGVRAARGGYGLAVEERLDDRVERVLAAVAGCPVERCAVAELGEITPLVAGARRALFVLAGRALDGNGRSWAVLEAGPRDRNTLRRLSVPVTELAPATSGAGAIVAVRSRDLARCVSLSRGRDSTS